MYALAEPMVIVFLSRLGIGGYLLLGFRCVGQLVVDLVPLQELCGLRSIGQQEFYQASVTDFHPELKFVLADYLEYENEALVEHNGQRYRVLRTYRTGQELEIIVERAPAEEGGVYGR